MAMQAVYELGTFEIIDKAGPGAKALCFRYCNPVAHQEERCTHDAESDSQVLASYSVVECSLDVSGAQRIYSLNSASIYYVPNKDGASLGLVILLVQDQVFLESW